MCRNLLVQLHWRFGPVFAETDCTYIDTRLGKNTGRDNGQRTYLAACPLPNEHCRCTCTQLQVPERQEDVRSSRSRQWMGSPYDSEGKQHGLNTSASRGKDHIRLSSRFPAGTKDQHTLWPFDPAFGAGAASAPHRALCLDLLLVLSPK